MKHAITSLMRKGSPPVRVAPLQQNIGSRGPTSPVSGGANSRYRFQRKGTDQNRTEQNRTEARYRFIPEVPILLCYFQWCDALLFRGIPPSVGNSIYLGSVFLVRSLKSSVTPRRPCFVNKSIALLDYSNQTISTNLYELTHWWVRKGKKRKGYFT